MAERSRFGSLSLGLTQIRRSLSSRPAIVVSLFVAVLTSTFLLASTPRLLEEVSAEDLGATVSQPDPAQRNIAIERMSRLGPGPVDDPLVRLREFGEQFAEREIPPSIQAIIGDSSFLFESPQFAITPLPGEDPPHPFDMFLRMTYLERIDQEATLVSGSLPSLRDPVPLLAGEACPPDEDLRQEVFDLLMESEEPLTDSDGVPIDCFIEEVTHYEVAVSAETADAMGLDVGRQMVLDPDTSDPLFFGLPLSELEYQLVFSISGILELSDPELEYWYGDNDLHRPRIRETADFRIIFATGLINPDAYRDLFADVAPAALRYIYRELVSPPLVEVADLEVLVPDLREFVTEYSPVVSRPDRPRVVTQLPDLLEDHLDQRAQTVAVMSTTVAGLFTVAVAVVLLLSVLMTSRQRHDLVYERNRGAGRAQLVLTRIYEGILLTVPAAALGYLVSGLIFEDTDDLLSYRITVALSTAAVGSILIAASHLIGSPLGKLQRDTDPPPRTSSRRLVGEVLVITLAAGSIVLLRRRGQVDSNAATTTFDWLLALAPALISVATALVTVRIFPQIVRGFSWVAAQFRGLVGFIGFKRILGRNSGGLMALAVVLICVSISVFAAVSQNSVANGQQVSSYQATGADYNVKAFSLHENLLATVDLSGVESIEASAFGTTFARGRVVTDATDLSAEVYALDGADYATVTSGTLGDVVLPDALTGIPQPGEGTEDNPMPAIVSDDWPTDFDAAVGDVLTINLGRFRPVIEVVEVRPRFPDIPVGRPFVVFNRQALIELSEFPVAPTVQYIKADESAGPEIAAVLNNQAPSSILTSRYEMVETLTADPFVSWVTTGLTTVFVFAGVFSLIAAVSSLALTSARRRVDFAYLKTLGLNNRQATELTILEQLPGVLIATMVGSSTGVGIALAFDPAIKFDGFTGSLVPTRITVEWGAIVALGAVVFLAMSAAIVMFVLSNRGQDLGKTLRVGDE